MTTIPEETPAPDHPGKVIAFVHNGQEVRVDEVIRAALFRDEIRPHWLDLLTKLACGEHASDRELELDREALQALANQFRYKRDLITAEEMDRWLELRKLDTSDFTEHIARSYWHGALSGTVAPLADDFLTAAPERRAQLTTELLFTGAIDKMERDLTWRMAAARALDASSVDLPDLIATERVRFLKRTGLSAADLDSWLAAVGGNKAWFEKMVADEAAYRAYCEKIVTPERTLRALRTQRLALTRLEVESMEFDTLDAAREAAHCVREDGLSLSEIARESGFPYSVIAFLLQDLPEDWQILLFSTPEGGLAGPLDDNGLFRLFRINHKIEPAITDEALRSRLEQGVLETAFAELCSKQEIKSTLARSPAS